LADKSFATLRFDTSGHLKKDNYARPYIDERNEEDPSPNPPISLIWDQGRDNGAVKGLIDS
jgi:hypothetical protein